MAKAVKTPVKPKNPQKNQKQHKKYKEDFVQNYIPIKNIANGIIETTDGRFIKIIEIEPINFVLRSEEEQYNIICSFASWLKIAPVRMQFKSITRQSDTNKHIENVLADIKNEKNKSCIELSKDYIELIKNVGNREALTRRFFIIFQYEPQRQADGYNFDAAVASLTAVEQTARQYFNYCGNSIIKWKNPNNAVAEILYTYFNRNSCVNESFQSRVNRVIKDHMESKGLVPGKDPVPKIRFLNYISPRGIDFTHNNYFVMDGLYYTVLALRSNGFNAKVRGGWISRFVNAGEGIDVDIHVKKEDRSKVTDKITHKITLNSVKLKDSRDTNKDYDELMGSIKSGYYIKDALTNYNEDLYYISVFITISAKTHESLVFKKQQVINMLKANDFTASTLNFQQEEALNTVMPLLTLPSAIESKTKRNVTTSGLASTYMFTSFEMCDDTGVLLGINQYNNSLCIVDIFNTKKHKNANMNLIGTSGSGKTFTMQLLALRMRMRGIRCFILAPIKGREFRRACNAIGGTYVRIAPGSQSCINIMEIRETSSPDLDLIDEADHNEMSMLANKIQQIMTFFTLLIPDMTNEEEQMLDGALVKTYNDFGITHDNDSLYVDKEKKIMKTMPILGDLYNNIRNNKLMERVGIIISRFVTGSAQSFNQQTNVDLNNKYVVLDLSDLKGKLLPLGMMIALDYVWDMTKANVTEKKVIMIDEIWQLIGASSNKQAADFCLTIFKTIRGFGGAAISATQDLSDFFGLEDGKYGRAIINNSKNKILLNLEPDEAKYVQDVLKLSKSEIQQISRFERGECLILSGSSKVPLYVKASAKEQAMITTDRAELAAILAQKKAELQAETQNNE